MSKQTCQTGLMRGDTATLPTYPARADAEIQKHLGLDMDKRIFDR